MAGRRGVKGTGVTPHCHNGFPYSVSGVHSESQEKLFDSCSAHSVSGSCSGPRSESCVFVLTECHEPRQRWCLFLFGRCSTVVVAGLLAAIDSLSVCFGYWVIGYTCFVLGFVCRVFKDTRPAGYLCGLVFCFSVIDGVIYSSLYSPDYFCPVVWTGTPCVLA